MARTTTPEPTGDTPKQIEDKVRDLPANQGLNEADMWVKIDAEVAQAQSGSTLKSNEVYPAASTLNKHGNK
jgi:hypothetical protein